MKVESQQYILAVVGSPIFDLRISSIWLDECNMSFMK